MLRRTLTGLSLALASLSGCSLLFAPAEGDGPPPELTRDLVSTIGLEADFETLDEWLLHRDGSLPLRQVMLVKSLGNEPGGQAGLSAVEGCSGLLRSVRASAPVNGLLILDLNNDSPVCQAQDRLVGANGVELEVLEVLSPGVTETLVFESSPVLGPLNVPADRVETSIDTPLILRAGIAHEGIVGAGIAIENPPNTSEHGLRIGTDHTQVIGFEIREWIGTDGADPFAGLRIAGSFVEVDSMLIHGEGNRADSRADGITTGSNNHSVTIRNSFLFHFSRAGIDYGRRDDLSEETPLLVQNTSIRGCTIRVDGGGRYGCLSYQTVPFTAVNTLAAVDGGFGEAFNGNLDLFSHHNAADDGTARGLPAFPVSASDFVSAQDLHLSDPDGILARCGEPQEGYQNDIDGETRGEAWSIGADQAGNGATCPELL